MGQSNDMGIWPMRMVGQFWIFPDAYVDAIVHFLSGFGEDYFRGG